jgi:hypothetical protein
MDGKVPCFNTEDGRISRGGSGLLGMVRYALCRVLRVCNHAVHHARAGWRSLRARGTAVWSNVEVGLISLLPEGFGENAAESAL